MDSNEFHKWLIESFGEEGGKMAWEQFSSLPDSIKDELLSQSHLPSPSEMRKIYSAFQAAGQEGQDDKGAVNQPLITQMALKTAEEKHFKNTISALQFDRLSQATSSANLWLDSASSTLPLPEKTKILTPRQWTEGSVKAWTSLVTPMAQAMQEAATKYFMQLGNWDYEIFAGGIPLPGINADRQSVIRSVVKTNFAIQLGSAIGEMSILTLASFDYGVRTVGGKAGALIAENLDAFAQDTQLPKEEVYAFYALREMAYARLYNSAPWIEGQICTLVYKYSRDMDLGSCDTTPDFSSVDFMNPSGLSHLVNLSTFKTKDTEEQKKAKESLQRLLTLVESWVDCVTWRAGSAFIPHISELREMMRRRRAEGEMTGKVLAKLMGLGLDPKYLREMCAKWDKLSGKVEERDKLWSHPRLLSKVDGKKEEESENGNDWDLDFTNLFRD